MLLPAQKSNAPDATSLGPVPSNLVGSSSSRLATRCPFIREYAAGKERWRNSRR